jgi:hypothetical protein
MPEAFPISDEEHPPRLTPGRHRQIRVTTTLVLAAAWVLLALAVLRAIRSWCWAWG